MGLRKIRGIKNYLAEDSGLRDLGTSKAVGDAVMDAAQRLAGSAQAVGDGTYEAKPATVTAGWANERRAGAIVREVSPHWRDSRDAVLLRVRDAMEVRAK